LEAAGCAERVSLKSYQEQGIDKTPQTHMGYAADKLEKRRRIETKPGNQNRKVKQDNLIRDVKRSRQPEPYARDTIEGWHHSRWEWMNRLHRPDLSEDREGVERQVVAEAEQAAWFGLGMRTRITLYYHGHEVNNDSLDGNMAARHQAVLERVLDDNRLGSPIRLAETVNSLSRMSQEDIEESWDYSHMNREGYGKRDNLSQDQEKER
jgi:hypothetical protein